MPAADQMNYLNQQTPDSYSQTQSYAYTQQQPASQAWGNPNQPTTVSPSHYNDPPTIDSDLGGTLRSGVSKVNRRAHHALSPAPSMLQASQPSSHPHATYQSQPPQASTYQAAPGIPNASPYGAYADMSRGAPSYSSPTSGHNTASFPPHSTDPYSHPHSYTQHAAHQAMPTMYPTAPTPAAPMSNNSPYAPPAQQQYSSPSAHPSAVSSGPGYYTQPSAYQEPSGYNAGYGSAPTEAFGYTSSTYSSAAPYAASYAAAGYPPPSQAYQGHPGGQTGGFQQERKPTATGGIDSRQIPNPIHVHAVDQATYDAVAYHPDHHTVAPFSSTDFYGYDASGNSNPKMLRPTLRQIPLSEDGLKNSGLLLGLAVTPFGKLRPDEQSPPVVHLPTALPVRCEKCAGYMNPFCKFLDGGRKFECSLCQGTNPVPVEYMATLDGMNRRVDINERPELLCGAFELLAPKEYQSRVPGKPSIMFMIDVSVTAIQSGMLLSAVKSIKSYISRFSSDSLPWKFGLVTFDNNIHFYNCNGGMSVVSDLEVPYLPVEPSLLFTDVPTVLSRMVDRLPSLYQSTNVTHSCLGSALEFAGLVLDKLMGGQLVVFQNALPSAGKGALTPRDMSTMHAASSGSSSTVNVLEPQTEYYRELGGMFSQKGISVDLFLCPTHPSIDVASFGLISSITDGRCHPYWTFRSDKDEPFLIRDLAMSLDSYRAFDGIVRVRVGNGLVVSEHHGTFHPRNSTDLEFAKFDESSTFTIRLSYDGSKIQENTVIPIQVAVLFTDALTGQRKIRLLHCAFIATSNYQSVFKGADMDALLVVLTQASIASCNGTTLASAEIKKQIFGRCVQALAGYRRLCSSHSASGQLVLPESIKLLPLYVLSLVKCKLFRDPVAGVGGSGGRELTADKKVTLLRMLKGASPSTLEAFLYPKLFHLNAPPTEDKGDSMLPMYRRVPQTLLSYGLLEPTGIYLLDGGVYSVLWIGQQASGDELQELFQVATIDQVPSYLGLPPQAAMHSSAEPASDSHSELAERFATLLSALELRHSHVLPMTIIRQHLDAPVENDLITHSAMVHDKSPYGYEYLDFLCLLHSQIQSLISN